MSRLGLDLLRPKGLRALVRWPLFPVGLQILALVGLLALAANGWSHGTELDASTLKTFRKTNLTTLAVWGLWWPAMILVVLAAGRAWCTVCPLELVARLGHRLGRVGWTGVSLPRWARAAWPALGVYLLMQAAVAGLSVHRVPHLTAVMLLALLGIALLGGLLLRHPRGFCVALCPAAPLLSAYSRLASLQLDRRSDEICAGCTTRACVDGSTRDRLDGRGCPSLIRPFAREQGDGCVLCLQCAKTCPHDNIGYGMPRGEGPRHPPAPLRAVELAFVAIIFGFATYEVAGEAPAFVKDGFLAIPALLATLPLPIEERSWQAIWYLLLFPAAFWAVIIGALKLAGGTAPMGTRLRAALTGALAATAAAHACKALAKLSSWGAYLPGALRDPDGVTTLAALADGALPSPERPIPFTAIAALSLILLLTLAWRARPRRSDTPAHELRPRWIGAAAAAIVFLPIIATWFA